MVETQALTYTRQQPMLPAATPDRQAVAAADVLPLRNDEREMHRKPVEAAKNMTTVI